MSITDDRITILSESDSWQLLASVPVGRLVTSADGQPEVFPVNFVVQGRTVLFRTAEGTKLASTVINNRVVFEADGHNGAEGWSVIVKGIAHVVRTDDDLANAHRAGLQSWTAPVKDHRVRVIPTTITGRRFRFSAQAAPAA
jgi:uncharacterized protein